MKLSFNRTVKRMRVRFEVSEFENGAYFFDYGCVVGKLIENEILQLVVQDENEVKLLVLARNMKRKCGQRTDCCRHGVCREVSEWRNAQMPEKKKVRSCSKR